MARHSVRVCLNNIVTRPPRSVELYKDPTADSPERGGGDGDGSDGEASGVSGNGGGDGDSLADPSSGDYPVPTPSTPPGVPIDTGPGTPVSIPVETIVQIALIAVHAFVSIWNTIFPPQQPAPARPGPRAR